MRLRSDVPEDVGILPPRESASQVFCLASKSVVETSGNSAITSSWKSSKISWSVERRDEKRQSSKMVFLFRFILGLEFQLLIKEVLGYTVQIQLNVQAKSSK